MWVNEKIGMACAEPISKKCPLKKAKGENQQAIKPC
ncbi:hypothetical protein Aazo_1176 ['Nostoc azollae' 0708]|uniref:Uncharacterized protein n=1 Tax=Nostoc azollae (strain 0708) TaxID=551115 RepID=D7E375_NOSA0|nr:hypothetical protein Aazo_1176 ['Nostoc azollae' 0708]